MKKHINKALKRLGYVPQVEFNNLRSELQYQAQCQQSEINRLNELHTDKIVKALNNARMYTVEYETPYGTVTPGDMSKVGKVMYKQIPPSTPDWYALTTKLDVGLLRRVNEDMLRFGNSPELDYFLEMVMRQLIEEAKIAMRMTKNG